MLRRGYTKTAHRQNGPHQNGPKNFNAQKIVQKRPIALSKTAHHTTKTAHSKVQNGPLSLSAFANVQSDLKILYVEANYTRVRGLDDSETVKCSAMHYGVTCSKFKSLNGSTVCEIATQHFPPIQIPHKFNHESHVRLRNNIRLSTAIIVTFCRDYYIPGARPEFNTVRPST